MKILVTGGTGYIGSHTAIELLDNGYAVEIANDGLNALEKFSQNPPQAVILDIMLPKIDGIEVLKRMRKSGNIPVIMLTAKNMERDKVKGLEEGADDYITKPFGIKELLARINSVLRRYNINTQGKVHG